MRPNGCSATMATAKTTVADIARDLGMSPANVYRFFASKVEIHQAICGRMLAASYQQAYDIRHLPVSASERLRLSFGVSIR
jgi:AcrR family transcriptional regulator